MNISILSVYDIEHVYNAHFHTGIRVDSCIIRVSNDFEIATD